MSFSSLHLSNYQSIDEADIIEFMPTNETSSTTTIDYHKNNNNNNNLKINSNFSCVDDNKQSINSHDSRNDESNLNESSISLVENAISYKNTQKNNINSADESHQFNEKSTLKPILHSSTSINNNKNNNYVDDDYDDDFTKKNSLSTNQIKTTDESLTSGFETLKSMIISL